MSQYRRSKKNQKNEDYWNRPVFEKNKVEERKRVVYLKDEEIKDKRGNKKHSNLLIWWLLFLIFTLILILVGVVVFATKTPAGPQTQKNFAQVSVKKSSAKKHFSSKDTIQSSSLDTTEMTETQETLPSSSNVPEMSSNAPSDTPTSSSGKYTLKTVSSSGRTSITYFDDLQSAINQGIALVNSGQAINYWVTNSN
ncbi:hypothetical protein [Lactococcus allomyrinae]|uniref:Uncharacterized protein n=1 Tax=Lactococcus allomyrinae TaxID=2419773 RepID=A0A387BBK2_9LACT|nr:hypothetical protein [Lactococcus allomyrinae]AYF99787.1 hypothetical protein D7I46_01025 [Lactococcus allomyrinae]